jgi:hypothetical protein
MITVIMRAAIALMTCVGLAHAQGQVVETIEGFEGPLRERFEQACQSIQLFATEMQESSLLFEEPRWIESVSQPRCVEAHMQVLSNLSRERRDRMYRLRYNEAIETCLRTLQMPARADACEDFASEAARRTYLRDYVEKVLTGEACGSLFPASGEAAWRSGFCVSFDMPPGDEEQWKILLPEILQPRIRKETDVLPCLPLEADTISPLTRGGFDCKSTSDAAGDQRSHCRRSFQLHRFFLPEQPGTRTDSNTSIWTIEIDEARTRDFGDLCLKESSWSITR